MHVQFTDQSIASPSSVTSWEWDFNEDGIIDATIPNPTWVYNDVGLYSVTLTVSDGTNTNTFTESKLRSSPLIREVFLFGKASRMERRTAGYLLKII